MKKTILLTITVLFFNSVFSQVVKISPALKSKNKRTVAWVLLGTGTAAIITGALIDNAHKGYEETYTGGFLELGGALCTLTSIPFFISATKNKKREAALSLNSGKILLLQNNAVSGRMQPIVSLHVRLGR